MKDHAPASFPLELYRGCVNAWECDEMGHMNVRFYIARAMESALVFAARIGLRRAHQSAPTSQLIPRAQHIRFLKKARAGAPLNGVGGVVAHDETTVQLYQELRHADGAPAATLTTLYAHADARTGRVFAWPDRARATMDKLACTIPAHGQPRSIDVNTGPSAASVAIAEALGVGVIGRGAVLVGECDTLGAARPEIFIARVSDAMPNLMGAWREAVAKDASKAGKDAVAAGAAVLEYRILYRRWPRVGDLLEVRSAVASVEEKTHRFVHWVLDPLSGEAWATAEAVAVTFDLKTRKTIKASDAQRRALEAMIVAGMEI
jgi:acyl-CoA thioester hydrolase